MASSKAAPVFSDDEFPPLSAPVPTATPRQTKPSSDPKALIKPGQTSVFLTIPLEIRNYIYPYLLVHDLVIDITVPHKKRGVIPNHFKRHVPDLKNVSILHVCQQTEKEGMRFMYSSNRFYSRNSDTINKLPDLLGELGTASIQYLDLNSHFMLKIHTRHVWSNSLDFFVKKLSSLKKFCFRTDFAVGADPLVETPGADRFGQERRALLKFGAFLTSRHPILKRLIWPADSGLTNDGTQWRVDAKVELMASDLKRVWGKFEKYENPGDANKKTFEDLLLNSTAIRRVAWLDLDSRPVTDFAMDKELPSSEVEETNSYFDLVHQFGYLTIKELKQNDADHLPSVDKMIRDAESNTKKSGRGRHQRGRGQRAFRYAGMENGPRGNLEEESGRDGTGNRGGKGNKFRHGWGPIEGNRKGRGAYY